MPPKKSTTASSSAVKKSVRARSKSPVKGSKTTSSPPPKKLSSTTSSKKISSATSAGKATSKTETEPKESQMTQEKETKQTAHPAPTSSSPPSTPVKVIEFGLKAFQMNVIEDATGLLKETGKWPLVIDECEKVAVFLHFQNAKELDIAIQKDMDPENIRRGVLGAIRYGHPVMLQLHDISDFHFVWNLINQAHPNLLEDILSKEILKPEKYLALRRREIDDMEIYDEFQFNRTHDFMFIPVVSSRFPLRTSTSDKEWASVCTPIRIYNPEDRRKAAAAAENSEEDN